MTKQDYPRKALSTDKYATDEWIRAMFPVTHWYDPCPIDWQPDTHEDGLLTSWHDRCYYDPIDLAKRSSFDLVKRYQGAFVNPPYSNPLPWVKKAIEEAERGVPVVLLLKHDSSTEWYRLLHEAGARILLVNGRLKYCTGKTAAFPSMLAVLS